MEKTKLDIAMNWIINSSKDPNKTSLFVQGLVGTIISVLVTIATVSGYHNLPVNDLNILAQEIAGFVGIVSTCISAAFSIFGLVRKIYRTIKGTNRSNE